MELIVIRHGETQANAEGRYQGALDIGLNQDGARHICWLANEIATTLAPFDRLLASPLLRTRESAAIFSRQLGLPVELAPAFRERHVGLFEERPRRVIPSCGCATSPGAGRRLRLAVRRWMR